MNGAMRLAALAAGLLELAGPARAGPQIQRLALVIGNGDYTGLPPIPGCIASAQAVAAALTAAGFRVQEEDNLSNGQMSGALSGFAEQLAAARPDEAVVYACGYTASQNGRLFLLPVTAHLSGPSDVLTQGVLAATLRPVLAPARANATLVLLDTVPGQGDQEPAGVQALLQDSPPPGFGTAVATEAGLAPVVTPFARAIAASVAAPDFDANAVLRAVRDAGGPQVQVQFAASAPASPRGPAAPPVAPAPPATAEPPASTARAATAAPLSVVPQVEMIPAEDPMSEQDRRRVQGLLGALGYYDGRVDGVFGPESRAAIRRFQHEIGAPITGSLTAAEAARLEGQR